MTNDEIRLIAEDAYDGSKGIEDPVYAELDAQAQSMLFDTANAIVSFGGPTTAYELKVAELVATTPPEVFAAKGAEERFRKDEERLRKERDVEKARIAAWKGAVTDKEKDRREKEEDRLDKEEDRIKKAKAAQKVAPKNGPDKK